MSNRVKPEVVPAFRRRAIASDLMTWHYETPAHLAMHLAHDHRFFPWMAARGLNAFCYVRHTVDSRARIAELAPLHRGQRIASEYGGHVLQLLMPREHFTTRPDLFPVGADSARNPNGNLCVSNPDALAIVRNGALRFVRENPECALLHLWGADVWDGAWCRCSQCVTLTPQLQYMRVINAIADALSEVGGAPQITYLAYHDTIEPDAALQPLPNVAFEWAPRERCYSHGIDDPACETNPRYWESLKRYLEIFDGRGHVFEYYADAILFGGLCAATPAIIVGDLRAYRSLGIESVSCLTFGQHSWIAYPINLETFACATHSPDFEPARMIADTAAEHHPRCAREMAKAYEAIARGSASILSRGGDVMRPRLEKPTHAARMVELKRAYAEITTAIEAADSIVEASRDGLVAAEREVWIFSRDAISGIADYLAADMEDGAARGAAAIREIAAALDQLRAAAPGFENTWAAYDLEWINDIWIEVLARRFEHV